MRRARDTAHLTSLGVHLRRQRQERPGQRPQGTRRRRHVEVTTHNDVLRFRRVAVVFAARGVSTMPASGVTLLAPARVSADRRACGCWTWGSLTTNGTRFDAGGFGLRMVGVGLQLVLRVLMERLATS